MKDCFALRFNLQKSGWDGVEDLTVLGGLFGEDPDFLRECLEGYETLLDNEARKIREELETLPESMGKILLLGDSITSDRLSYGKLLGKLYPGAVIDGAVSCSRSLNVAERLGIFCQEHSPDILSVMIGTNDYISIDKTKEHTAVSPEEFARNIAMIGSLAKTLGMKLVLHSIPCARYGEYSRANPLRSAHEENRNKFNGILRKEAEQMGAAFLDMDPIFAQYDKALLFEPDGIHLSFFAHSLWARAFVRKLEEEL